MTKEIAPGIFIIDTKPLGHEQLISAYLIKGDRTMLIDPGFPSSVSTVYDSLTEAGVAPEDLDYVALTHSHIDHAGGAGLIMKRAANARIVCHQRGSFYLRNSIKIGGGSKMVFGKLADDLGEPIDIPEERIEVVGEGDQVDLGNMKLNVVYTPGHSGDHISYFEESTRSIITGDVACLHYPQLGHAMVPAGSPPIYRSDYVVNELKTLSELQPLKILTPHFGEGIGDPNEFLSANIRSVIDSKRDIDQMFREGMEFPQVIERLRTDIIAKSGMSETSIPPFLADTWLRLMLNTGLMGMMADILEYARDIRPFKNLGQEGDAFED